MLVVLCMTSFSVTAFASGGEAITEPETETTTGTDTPSTDETAEDAEEIPYTNRAYQSSVGNAWRAWNR